MAWETEVWIVDNPDHMIHFNGDRFLESTCPKIFRAFTKH
ncbi:TPA: BsuBI/PstI family type II restriction endonuclease [Photobacterium damselae]